MRLGLSKSEAGCTMIARSLEGLVKPSSPRDLCDKLLELQTLLRRSECTYREKSDAATFLLQHVVTLHADAKAAFKACLDSCGPLVVLEASRETLRCIAEETITFGPVLDTVLDALYRFFFSTKENSTLAWSRLGGSLMQGEWSKVVPWLVPLSGLVSNAAHALKTIAPPWCHPEETGRHLVRCASFLVAETDGLETFRSYWCVLVRALSRGRGGVDVVQGVRDFVGIDERRIDSLAPVWTTCLRDLPVRDTAILCSQLLVSVSKMKSPSSLLERLCSSDLLSVSDIAHAFVARVVFDVVVPGPKTSETICESLIGLLHRHGILADQLEMVSEQWAHESFVKRSSFDHQRLATTFVLASLRTLHDETDWLESPVSQRLLGGVSVRLNSSIKGIRTDGMRVGEALATMLGQHIRFDELDNEREVAGQQTPRIETVENGEEHQVVDQHIGPDTEYLSDSESSSSFDSSDEDRGSQSATTKYCLDDDALDNRGIGGPKYLRECLDYLRLTDDDTDVLKKKQAALRVIPDLVRSGPLDLADVGPALSRELLHVDESLATDDFGNATYLALKALFVGDPKGVGLTLIPDYFQSELLLRSRWLILDALSGAAREMAGLVAPGEKRSKSMGAPITSWGTSVLASQRTSLSDMGELSSVGALWFYEILRHFLRSRDDASLWGNELGSRHLTHLLRTMGNLISCCQFVPGVDMMARNMVQVSLSFLDADDDEVRESALLCLVPSVESLHTQDVLALMSDESIGGLRSQLISISQADGSQTCRHMAARISNAIVSSLSKDRYLGP